MLHLLKKNATDEAEALAAKEEVRNEVSVTSDSRARRHLSRLK